MSHSATGDWRESLAFFASPLFRDVQLAGLFDDSKTFADAIADQPLSVVCNDYDNARSQSRVDLIQFVERYFRLPAAASMPDIQENDVDDYIASMWSVLHRRPDTPRYDSLIPLRHNYVVPGGRFREIYYWDSYFTAVGLLCDGHADWVVSMFENFLDIQQHVGCIPNGNRAYYHSRSQPPVLILLYDLICDQLSEQQQQRAIKGLMAEYEFWMQGAEQLSDCQPTAKRTVRMPDGSVLNRYYDTACTPRPESFREDIQQVQGMNEADATQFLRDIRAACESGWDFSSRWMADAADFQSLRTTDIVPVDLNGLLYRLEQRLSELVTEPSAQQRYQQAAASRRQAVSRYLYDPQRGFFFDYSLADAAQTSVWSLAAVVPLFVELADEQQARHVAAALVKFLKPGGLVTTLNETVAQSPQQWDAPNGWAPLQWFAVNGLRRYGYTGLAIEIAERWLGLVQRYYQNNGVVLEKYDVCNPVNRASGGEYEVQLGFGWTNGVYRAFQSMLINTTED